MITIDAKTKEVRNAHEHVPQVWYIFPCNSLNITSGYIRGLCPPNYPVPATIGRISLGEHYWHVVFIDDANEDDPQMLYVWDQEGVLACSKSG